MSISARVRHVMSAMLIVVFASTASAWTAFERTTHCQPQAPACDGGTCSRGEPWEDDPCGQARLACCALAAPIPAERVPLPQPAPSPADGSIASLIGHVSPTSVLTGRRVRSPQWLRALDLPVLHQTLVI